MIWLDDYPTERPLSLPVECAPGSLTGARCAPAHFPFLKRSPLPPLSSSSESPPPPLVVEQLTEVAKMARSRCRSVGSTCRRFSPLALEVDLMRPSLEG